MCRSCSAAARRQPSERRASRRAGVAPLVAGLRHLVDSFEEIGLGLSLLGLETLGLEEGVKDIDQEVVKEVGILEQFFSTR